MTGVEGILTGSRISYRVVLSVDLLQKAVAVEVDISAWSGWEVRARQAVPRTFQRDDQH